MSIEKQIFESYNLILSNKKFLSEVTDVYDNVDFKDYAVGGNSTPSRDTINLSLLNDIQTAARNAGLKVDVTTAVSGHHEGQSRHPSGNAVDIAIINGKNVSTSNRGDADKLVAELIKLGYVKNSESGNAKAVLTFGFPGHDDHVHVSNSGEGSSSSDTSTSGTTQGKYDIGLPPGYTSAPEWAKTLAKTATGKLTEAYQGERFYLQFCNVSNPMVKNGQQVSIGTLLGKTTEDVEVFKYDSSKSRVNLKKSDFNLGKNVDIYLGVLKIPKETNEKIKSPVSGVVSNLYNTRCKNQITIEYQTKDETEASYDKSGKQKEMTYKDPAMAAILTLPAQIFKNQHDDSGKLTQKRFGYSGEKVDPWVKDAIVKPFKKIGDLFRKENKEEEEKKQKKIDENVQKIKKLLK